MDTAIQTLMNGNIRVGAQSNELVYNVFCQPMETDRFPACVKIGFVADNFSLRSQLVMPQPWSHATPSQRHAVTIRWRHATNTNHSVRSSVCIVEFVFGNSCRRKLTQPCARHDYVYRPATSRWNFFHRYSTSDIDFSSTISISSLILHSASE